MKIRLSFLLIAIAVCALPTLGQITPIRDVTYDDGTTSEGWYAQRSFGDGAYLDNPCTSWYDQVWVNYNVYLTQEGMKISAGERVIFNENTTMGGSTYAAQGSTTSDVTYKQLPYTLRKYHKVNTSDMFHVVTVIDFDPPSNSSYVSMETACGDGTPDSKQ